MENYDLSRLFAELSTPLIADACLRQKLTMRIAPPGIRPLIQGSKLAGRVIPARHYGSVDVFLEALMAAIPGDVLVIDNGGRSDEGCVGDLTALEAKAAGLAGMVLWGSHRDTAELLHIGFRLFSYGTCPNGPKRLEARHPEALISAQFGDITVSREDAVFADGDGVIFVPLNGVEEILSTAMVIRETERKQAELLQAGRNLREQMRFDEYLRKREVDPDYTFREHLRQIGAAIEE